MASQEQPAILFLVCSPTEAEIYFHINVYLGLKGKSDVGQGRKNVASKRECRHPISFRGPAKHGCSARPRRYHWNVQVIIDGTSLPLC